MVHYLPRSYGERSFPLRSYFRTPARAGRAAVLLDHVPSKTTRSASAPVRHQPLLNAVHQLADAQSTQIWAPLIVIGIEPTVAHIGGACAVTAAGQRLEVG